MSNAFQYRDNWYTLATPWLTTGDAEQYMYTLQLCTDVLLEKMDQAIQIRLPGQGDPSQLPFLAHDRQLVQGPAEPDASFVLRLQQSNQTWGLAGSARAVLLNLQAYVQGLQPGVASSLPLLTIVRSGGPLAASWHQLYQGDQLGAPPTIASVPAGGFDWDGKAEPWRAWLILPMALVSTAQSGASGQTSTAATSACYTSPGQNVSGVWVPATSGTPVNSPWVTLVDLALITGANLGQWITISGSSHAANNGTFPIVQVLSGTSVVIANPAGVASDTGPLTWSIGEYPWIGPGMPYGSPGVVYGQGETAAPPIDTGSNSAGTWGPTPGLAGGSTPTVSWGLTASSQTLVSLRQIVKTWKSAATYYQHIIVAFDAGSGAAGSAYSPNSTEGAGNPGGAFGDIGHNVNGAWVPTRLITSAFDCYCQGTGTYQSCSVENVT